MAGRPIFPGVTDGSLTIRPLAPADAPLLTRWLSDPRVLAFYEGRDNPHDAARVQAVFYDTLPENEVPCLVEWEGRPIGYLQFYRHDAEALADFGLEEGAFGMDQFIGEPDCWNRGIGSRMLRLMLPYLFECEGATRVTVDPLIENARAIRAYEKCGFVKRKRLPAYETHEGKLCDAWLMVATPLLRPTP